MMRSWLVCAAAMLAIGCGDKEGDSGAADSTAAVLSLSGDASNGAAVYASYCSGCHGADGEGISAPAMTAIVPDRSDEELVAAILNGVGSGMPAYAGTLTEQEVADVLAHLTASF
ncbi:unnamed protein product [Ectocarpus fasciculatus]